MPKGPARSLRVADQIQRELAGIIRTELKDPRVAMITLTGVEVTADYSHAKVFYTLMGGAEQRAETEGGLKQAGGFLRSQIARRIRCRKRGAALIVQVRPTKRPLNGVLMLDKA